MRSNAVSQLIYVLFSNEHFRPMPLFFASISANLTNSISSFLYFLFSFFFSLFLFFSFFRQRNNSIFVEVSRLFAQDPGD